VRFYGAQRTRNAHRRWAWVAGGRSATVVAPWPTVAVTALAAESGGAVQEGGERGGENKELTGSRFVGSA
jgi:hypothetical protein